MKCVKSVKVYQARKPATVSAGSRMSCRRANASSVAGWILPSRWTCSSTLGMTRIWSSSVAISGIVTGIEAGCKATQRDNRRSATSIALDGWNN